MSKKRTIDAYFNAPKAKKPCDSNHLRFENGPISLGTGSHISGNDEIIGLVTAANKQIPSYSTHASYPFSIPHLPDTLEAEISVPPARAARVIADQPDLDLLYFEPYISRHAARQLFEFLRDELPFYRVEYDIMRGGAKTHIRTPRWTTVFGLDETARFEASPPFAFGSSNAQFSVGEVIDTQTGKPIPVGHSDIHNTPSQRRQTAYKARPRPIPHCLDVLRKSTEATTGCCFNFCLVNYYASGADSISFHSDDERFLGELPAIASFSLGARRDFLMKHKPPNSESGETDNNGTPKEALKLPLRSGDMVLMRGKTQANWLHSIPKRGGKNEWDGGRINITFRRALVRGGTENYYQYNVGSGPVYKWNAASQEMKPWMNTLKP
ncbi:DNA repair family protein [Hypoxylon argillaceum]|nr:DNA repair family protein [Hypoxylon argillaceum]